MYTFSTLLVDFYPTLSYTFHYTLTAFSTLFYAFGGTLFLDFDLALSYTLVID